MDPDDLVRARHLITDQLRRWRCAEPDDAALVGSALAPNAVRHAGGAVQITVTHDTDDIRIEIHDHRSERPHLRPHSTEPGGLGLHIVDQLSRRWGSQPTTTGKLVWAVIACAHGSSTGHTPGGP